jgi:hypothetical protein
VSIDAVASWWQPSNQGPQCAINNGFGQDRYFESKPALLSLLPQCSNLLLLKVQHTLSCACLRKTHGLKPPPANSPIGSAFRPRCDQTVPGATSGGRLAPTLRPAIIPELPVRGPDVACTCVSAALRRPPSRGTARHVWVSAFGPDRLARRCPIQAILLGVTLAALGPLW